MVDEHLLLAARRLGSDLRDLKTSLRKNYPKPAQQVTSQNLKDQASGLAESWLANLSQRPEIISNVSPEYLGDLNVHFQRILVATEKATIRKRYDYEIDAVLESYTPDLVVPLMQANAQPAPAKAAGTVAMAQEVFRPTAFVGHSFSEADLPFVHAVTNTLQALGITVLTGEKPKADRISEKVKRMIDAQHIFVGIFTRRDKLEGKNAWTTSAWVLDEKAYAYGKGRKLILLKEADVDSIGGIQGDYEFLPFTRENFHEVIVKLIQLFTLSVKGLQE
jgi:hypothetical protein